MSRQRIEKKVYVGGRIEASLAAKFLSLARSSGVSMNEALRRVLVQTILEDRIPGIDALDLEDREREKWGPVTPTYTGEKPVKKTLTGHTAPVPPAE